MIQFFGEWIETIILVVLLATFIEMMFPSEAMSRYVQLVLSLLVLFTILSPILSFFHQDVQQDFQRNFNSGFIPGAEEGSAWTNWLDGDTRDEEVPGDLNKKVQEITLLQEEQTQALLEKTLAGRLEQQVETEFGVEVRDIQVFLQANETGQKEVPEIEQIVVALAKSQQESNASEMVKPIEPVEPVKVEISPDEHSLEEERLTDSVKANSGEGMRKHLNTESSNHQNFEVIGRERQIAEWIAKEVACNLNQVEVYTEEAGG